MKIKKINSYLTVSELAKQLKISRQAVLKRIKNGKIKAFYIGNFLVIPRNKNT